MWAIWWLFILLVVLFVLLLKKWKMLKNIWGNKESFFVVGVTGGQAVWGITGVERVRRGQFQPAWSLSKRSVPSGTGGLDLHALPSGIHGGHLLLNGEHCRLGATAGGRLAPEPVKSGSLSKKYYLWWWRRTPVETGADFRATRGWWSRTGAAKTGKPA